MTEEESRRMSILVWEQDVGALKEVIQEQSAEIDRLRAALRQYGVHGVDPEGYDCPKNLTFSASADCTCGLDALVEGEDHSSGKS